MIKIVVLRSDRSYSLLPAELHEWDLRLQGRSDEAYCPIDALHPCPSTWKQLPELPQPDELESMDWPLATETIALYQGGDAWSVPLDAPERSMEAIYWEQQGWYAASYTGAQLQGANDGRAAGNELPLAIIAGIVCTLASLALVLRYLW